MIHIWQSPWLSHQIVLMELVLMRLLRRERTSKGKERPKAEVRRATRQMLNTDDQRRRRATSAATLCRAAFVAHGLMRSSTGASLRSATSVSCAAWARNQ